jgi:uncharacterized protein
MKTMAEFALSALKIMGMTYILFCALLYFLQDKLIFIGAKGTDSLYRKHESRSIVLCSADRQLQGWRLESTQTESKQAVVYFGGNAEDVIHTLDWIPPSHRTHSWILANYPGYGLNPGKPSQQSIFDSADRIITCLEKEHGYPTSSIVLVGRSLGSGVATYLASKYPFLGVILVTPFDSLSNVAAEHYPIFPVHWLLRHPFDSLAFAQQKMPPMLMLTAGRDQIIPPRHSFALMDTWNGPVDSVHIENRNHNDIHLSLEYTERIAAFLKTHSVQYPK